MGGLSSLGMGEILILLVVVLIVFGARRLPEMGASLGRGLREFKRSLNEAADAMRVDDSTPSPPRPPSLTSGSPAPPRREGGGGEPKRLSE